MTTLRAPGVVFDRLLDAWLTWDERPKDPATADAMVEAVDAYAGAIGITSVELRRYLAAGRRSGLTHDRILDNTRLDLAKGNAA